MVSRTYDCDGHLFVLADIAGITKSMLTPADDAGGRDVFFDVLGKASIRVAIHAQTGDDVQVAITYIDGIRGDLAKAVVAFNDEIDTFVVKGDGSLEKLSG